MPGLHRLILFMEETRVRGAVPEDIPALEDVAKTLVANGAVYVAANERSLVDEPAQIYYHLRVGTADEQKKAIATYLAEEAGDQPAQRQLGVVRVADQRMPFRATPVLHSDLHLHRRVPVYVAEGVAGLDPVAIDDGVARARNVAVGETEVTPRRNETVPLETLVADLADAGAGSVEMSTEFLVDGQIELRIPMVPADGKPIVGPVDSVEIAGETYPLNTTLTLDGPCGSAMDWTALYINDDVRGLDPLSVEAGMDAARDLVASADDADTVRDLERPRDGRDDGPVRG